MVPVRVHPIRIRSFGSGEGAGFHLVTNTAVANQFEIGATTGYAHSEVVPYDGSDSFEDLLANRVCEPAHVLVVSPEQLFKSPRPSSIGKRKLITIPCNSTPTSLQVIERFLRVMERTNPTQQATFSERFYARIARHETLDIIDPEVGTSVRFDYQSERYVWHQQAGALAWGEQQIGPAGKLSVLAGDLMQYDPHARFVLNGDLALRGQPIVHSGAAPVLRDEQARIYKALATINKYAVIATVANGEIKDIRATQHSATAARMLETMFEFDSRYRVVWEIGFGINTNSPLFAGNNGLNEVYGGTDGVIHFGIGLTPFTRYALAFVCPASRVLDPNGKLVFGTPFVARR